ncbi:MliC family protein [Wenxinia marina]|nr:MliC family protein [Wenxinia marina]
MPRIMVTGAACLAATAAAADADMRRIDYTCDRGALIEAAYFDVDGEPEAVALTLEGRLIGLFAENTGAQVRYGWPSDGSNYVWLIEGGAAQLLWSNGAEQSESVLLQECLPE